MSRGWIVVAAVHAALAVAFGAAYSFAAFFTSLEREFGAGRGDIALVFAICGFLYFMIGAFSGQIADRVGPRWVALAGMAFLAAGLALASRAQSLAALYVTYSLGVGLGVGCVYVPAVGAIQPWFAKRRGLASGIAVAGIGLGTIVGPLLAGWLVPRIGWRGTFDAFALAGGVIGGIACWFIDNDPARRGLGPDGASATAGTAPPQVPGGIMLGAALRERSFWLLYGAITFCAIGLFVPFVHLLPFARDHGLSEAAGLWLTSFIGVGSLVGRFALAGIADRIPRRTLLAAIYFGMAGMLGVWFFSTQFVMLAVFAVMFGAFYGAFVALGPSITMDLYGARNVAGIIGALYSGAGLGNLLGPWLAGVAYDWSHSYSVPIAISGGCMLAAMVLALALRHEPARAEA